MREQPERLELGELAAHGRRRHVHARPLDERFRPDGLAGRDVLFDHPPQDLAPAGGELFHERTDRTGERRRDGHGTRSTVRSGSRARRRCARTASPPRATRVTARQSGSSSGACVGRTQERTEASCPIGSGRGPRPPSPTRIDVDAADHVAVVRIEHGVGEPAALLGSGARASRDRRGSRRASSRGARSCRRSPASPGCARATTTRRRSRPRCAAARAARARTRRHETGAAARSPRGRTAAVGSTRRAYSRRRAVARSHGRWRALRRAARPSRRRRGTGRAASAQRLLAAGPTPVHDREPAGDHPLERRARSTTRSSPASGSGSSRRRPSMSRSCAFVTGDRAARARAAARRPHAERGDVAADRGAVPAALLTEGRHRPDPDTEVVAPVPVA